MVIYLDTRQHSLIAEADLSFCSKLGYVNVMTQVEQFDPDI